MINAAIFASGSGTNAENLIKYFAKDNRIKFKLVFTNNPNAGVIARVEKYNKNVQILSKESLYSYSEQLIEFIKTEKIELIILAGFLLKIPEAFVKAFPDKIINIHPALLPKYGGKGMYGMHVHQAVIRNNEAESGITVHFVNEEYDEGKTILQAKCKVEPSDTPESLAKKIHLLEYEYFPKAVEKLLQLLEIS